MLCSLSNSVQCTIFNSISTIFHTPAIWIGGYSILARASDGVSPKASL